VRGVEVGVRVHQGDLLQRSLQLETQGAGVHRGALGGENGEPVKAPIRLGAEAAAAHTFSG
jgi:hypothetical protein